MYPDFVASTQSTFDVVMTQTVLAFNSFLPRIVGALLVLVIGAAIAKTLRNSH
jgi:uncharacterized membrane protein YeaQ/YmgE (transglycosylase-associated protein family)